MIKPPLVRQESDVILLADDHVFRVEMHQETSLLFVIWKVHLEGVALMGKYTTLLTFIKEAKPKGILSNAKAIYYTTIQDARWLFDTFIPALIEAGVSRYARLESEESLLILDSMNLEERVRSMSGVERRAFDFGYFIDEDIAIDWLVYGAGR